MLKRGGRVCLYGESSGGTWALDAAANVAGVDCVMTGAAPTDEDTWRRARRGPAFTFSHRIWPAFFGTGKADDAFEPLRGVVAVRAAHAGLEARVWERTAELARANEALTAEAARR